MDIIQRTTSLGFVTLVLAFAFCVPMFGQDEEGEHKVGRDPSTPFRYVIVAGVSEIEQFVNAIPGHHNIEVLMEDKAFNEKNLIALFGLLGKRFSDKELLSVAVYTSLDAVFTPEERDNQKLHEQVGDYKRFKYAFYVRNGFGEYFYYGIPRKSEKKVIIKAGPAS